MPHFIIITDRQGNEISVPGPHRHAEPEEGHEEIRVVIDIEKIIELHDIKTEKKKDKDG